MPRVYITVGIPGSGKTTWISNQQFNANTVITGSDQYIEKYAAEVNKTFDQVIYEYVDQAVAHMNQDIAHAIENKQDLVWDLANVTPSCRAARLAAIPAEYHKIAVAFPVPPHEEWERRLNNRPGKNIPAFVRKRLPLDFVMPSLDEGFDEVLIIQGE